MIVVMITVVIIVIATIINDLKPLSYILEVTCSMSYYYINVYIERYV